MELCTFTKLFAKPFIFLKFRWYLREKAIHGAIQMNLKNVSHYRVESFNGIYWFSLNWNLCWSECVARRQQSKCFHRCSTFSFNWNRDIWFVAFIVGTTVNHFGKRVSLVPKYSLLIFRQVGLVLENGTIAKLLDSYRVLLVTVVNVGKGRFNVHPIL